MKVLRMSIYLILFLCSFRSFCIVVDSSSTSYSSTISSRSISKISTVSSRLAASSSCAPGLVETEVANGTSSYIACLACSDNYYRYGTMPKCLECPDNARCIDNVVILEDRGYWLWLDDDSKEARVRPCYHPYCGEGKILSDGTVENQCDWNRDPESPLCGSCKEGTSMWNECVPCKTFPVMILLMLVWLYLMFCLVHFTARNVVVKILWFFVQQVFVIMDMRMFFRRSSGSYGDIGLWFLDILKDVFFFSIPITKIPWDYLCPFERSGYGYLFAIVLLPFIPIIFSLCCFCCSGFYECLCLSWMIKNNENEIKDDTHGENKNLHDNYGDDGQYFKKKYEVEGEDDDDDEDNLNDKEDDEAMFQTSSSKNRRNFNNNGDHQTTLDLEMDSDRIPENEPLSPRLSRDDDDDDDEDEEEFDIPEAVQREYDASDELDISDHDEIQKDDDDNDNDEEEGEDKFDDDDDDMLEEGGEEEKEERTELQMPEINMNDLLEDDISSDVEEEGELDDMSLPSGLPIGEDSDDDDDDDTFGEMEEDDDLMDGTELTMLQDAIEGTRTFTPQQLEEFRRRKNIKNVDNLDDLPSGGGTGLEIQVDSALPNLLNDEEIKKENNEGFITNPFLKKVCFLMGTDASTDTVIRLALFTHLPLMLGIMKFFSCTYANGHGMILIDDTSTTCLGWEWWLSFLLFFLPFTCCLCYCPFCNIVLLLCGKKKRRDKDVRILLGTYYDDYQENLYFMEWVYLFRRSLMAFNSVFIFSFSYYHPLFYGVGSMLNVFVIAFSLCLQLLCKPYKFWFYNRLEELSLLIFLVVLCVEYGSGFHNILSTFVVLIIVLGFSCLLCCCIEVRCYQFCLKYIFVDVLEFFEKEEEFNLNEDYSGEEDDEDNNNLFDPNTREIVEDDDSEEEGEEENDEDYIDDDDQQEEGDDDDEEEEEGEEDNRNVF